MGRCTGLCTCSLLFPAIIAIISGVDNQGRFVDNCILVWITSLKKGGPHVQRFGIAPDKQIRCGNKGTIHDNLSPLQFPLPESKNPFFYTIHMSD